MTTTDPDTDRLDRLETGTVLRSSDGRIATKTTSGQWLEAGYSTPLGSIERGYWQDAVRLDDTAAASGRADAYYTLLLDIAVQLIRLDRAGDTTFATTLQRDVFEQIRSIAAGADVPQPADPWAIESICPDCRGGGWAQTTRDSAPWDSCPTCDGRGLVSMEPRPQQLGEAA